MKPWEAGTGPAICIDFSRRIHTRRIKLRVISEDAHACHRFSNLISNASGVGHLPIFCEDEAFLEHKFILASASFVVLWCWWPLLAEAWLETRATRSHERTRAHGKFHSPTPVYAPVSKSARTHGLRWRTAHASSIDEKGLIYIYIYLRQLPPRLVRVLLVYKYIRVVFL